MQEMIKSLQESLKIKKQEFKVFESTFLETIKEINDSLNKHYFNPKRLEFPIELPKSRIGFIEKNGDALFIEFEDKKFTIIRILCSQGFHSDEPEFSEFNIDKHYLDHETSDYNTGERYIGALGYAKQYFCLNCIPEDLKLKYRQQFDGYVKLRSEMRDIEISLEGMEKAIEIRKRKEASDHV